MDAPPVAKHYVELRLLRYVIAVAEELHFGRAAKRLNLSPPALSKQIKDLEGVLGYLLFERKTREVVLTAAGVAFMADARQALVHVERAMECGYAASRGDTGVLLIGYSPWFRPSSLSKPRLPRGCQERDSRCAAPIRRLKSNCSSKERSRRESSNCRPMDRASKCAVSGTMSWLPRFLRIIPWRPTRESITRISQTNRSSGSRERFIRRFTNISWSPASVWVTSPELPMKSIRFRNSSTWWQPEPASAS